MAGKSTYLSNRVLDLLLGKTAYAVPDNLYFGLFTAAPTDAGGGTERTIGVGSYARVAVTNNAANFPAAAGGVKSNGTDIVFAPATSDWGSIVAVGIFDAASAGNLLYWCLLASPIPVPNGGTFSFTSTTVVFQED